MPRKALSAKRGRQYAHVKDSLLERGKPEPLADRVAHEGNPSDRSQPRQVRREQAGSLT